MLRRLTYRNVILKIWRSLSCLRYLYGRWQRTRKKKGKWQRLLTACGIAVIGKGKAARKYEYAKLESAATTELIRMCLEGWEDDDVLEDRNDEHDDDDDDDDDTE